MTAWLMKLVETLLGLVMIVAFCMDERDEYLRDNMRGSERLPLEVMAMPPALPSFSLD